MIYDGYWRMWQPVQSHHLSMFLFSWQGFWHRSQRARIFSLQRRGRCGCASGKSEQEFCMLFHLALFQIKLFWLAPLHWHFLMASFPWCTTVPVNTCCKQITGFPPLVVFFNPHSRTEFIPLRILTNKWPHRYKRCHPCAAPCTTNALPSLVTPHSCCPWSFHERHYIAQFQPTSGSPGVHDTDASSS